MSRKKSSLWDSDEDSPVVKNASTKPQQEVLQQDTSKIQKARLFDLSGSDSEDPTSQNSKLYKDDPKLKYFQQKQKGGDSLFDSSDSEPQPLSVVAAPLVVTSQTIDYKKLYELEVAKSKALEETVLALSVQVAGLQQELAAKARTVSPLPDAAEAADDDVKETADWSALAKEEKLRRQNKVHSLQSRQRAANQNKRLQTKGDGQQDGLPHSVSTGSLQGAAHEPHQVAAAPTGPGSTHNGVVSGSAGDSRMVQGRSAGTASKNYLDSSDEEDKAAVDGARKGADTTAVTAAMAGVGVGVGAGSVGGVDGASAVAEDAQDGALGGDAAADAEAAKWRELAEQEKLRKAQARRSVRTVRRPAPGPASGDGVTSQDGQARAAAVKQRPLRGAQYRPLQASATASSSATAAGQSAAEAQVNGQSGANGTSGTRSAERWDDDSGSDWSSESDWEEGDRAKSTPSPVPAPLANPRVEAPVGSRQPPAGATGAGAADGASCSAEAEAQLDRRLRRWAAGKSVAALLSTVPGVLVESAAALDGLDEVEGAVAPLKDALSRGGNGSGEIRKAYMKVIRACHPDKHMDLPPRSAAFLELQKVFTALSEAYNAFKAAGET